MRRRTFLKSTSAFGFAGSIVGISALQMGYMRQANAATFNDLRMAAEPTAKNKPDGTK